MFLEDLADYLETNEIGTVAEDIFIGDFPADKKEGIFLVLSPSPTPDIAFKWYELYVDFFSVNCKDPAAYDILIKVENLFHQKKFYEIGDYIVYLSNDLGWINDLGKDNQRRKNYMLSMRFITRIK